jgi:hypothetical protein
MLLDAIHFVKGIIMIHININDKQSCEDYCFLGCDTMQFGRKVAENIIPHTAYIKATLTVIKVFHYKLTASITIKILITFYIYFPAHFSSTNNIYI